MKLKSNKSIVLEFYKQAVGKRDSTMIEMYVDDHYIQHSPQLKPGKAGLLEAIEYLKQLPPPPSEGKSPIILSIAENDLVLLLLNLSFMGKHLAVVDLFRVQNGKIMEHWDAIQDITGQNRNPVFSNIKVDNDNLYTARNKSVIRSQFDEQDAHSMESISSKNFASELSHRSSSKIHRIIGEGNMVAVQSEAIKSGKPFVFYDILTIEASKIKEHWTVEQQIPDTMPHTNGMI